MVWVDDVRSYIDWSRDKCVFKRMLIITGSQEKYPAVNVIFPAEKHCIFKKVTVFFSYYWYIKCHFPSVINLSYIPAFMYWCQSQLSVYSAIQLLASKGEKFTCLLVSCLDHFVPPFQVWIYLQALVVQTLDSAIHWINRYPVDKY